MKKTTVFNKKDHHFFTNDYRRMQLKITYAFADFFLWFFHIPRCH